LRGDLNFRRAESESEHRHQGALMKSIFDSSFRYTRSVETDVRKTFERIRREQQAERRRKAMAANSDVAIRVVQIESAKRNDVVPKG
jgi:hypothetical protein